MHAVALSGSTHSLLQLGSRLLLVVAMGLFLAYLMFLLVALMISGAVTKVRALRRSRFTDGRAVVTPSAPSSDDPRGRRSAPGAVEHALSA